MEGTLGRQVGAGGIRPEPGSMRATGSWTGPSSFRRAAALGQLMADPWPPDCGGACSCCEPRCVGLGGGNPRALVQGCPAQDGALSAMV